MLKDASYKEKINMLQKWIPQIIETIKKDLKNDHLKQDFLFAKQYFLNKNVNKLTTEELVEGYTQAIAGSEKAEELAEFLSSRWLLKNTELYHYFEEKLSQINPDFSEIVEIEPKKAQEIISESVQQFGASRTYLFSILNSVVFPKEVYTNLAKDAEKSEQDEKVAAKELQEKQTLETIQRQCDQTVARLTDKYEKKILGLQKKYLQDTEMLKKQISQLHRKISG